MIHKYLRSVGFSECKTRKDINEILNVAIGSANERAYTTVDNDVLYAEYNAYFGDRIGINIRGEYTEDNKFIYDYYFPFIKGRGETSYDDITVEPQFEKLSYAGVLDDYRIGVSIIFYLQNIIPYMKLLYTDRLPIKGTSLTLSGLSTSGTILMPLQKDEVQVRKAINYNMRKNRMLAEARKGNEQAIEHLTIDDMDTYNIVRRKMKDEDIYSVVETYFMPYGVECDLYSILGEITTCEKITNTYTKEDVYFMTLNVNDLVFDVCINAKDLIGEPEEGRRFKGVIWLQGFVNYPE